MTASRVLRTALALLVLDAPLISADWFGWLGSRASDGLSYVSRAAVELEKNAATLSVDGRALTADEIEEPLLGARLAWLAYATSRRELESGLRRLGGGAELVHFAAQRDGSRPQWFLARIGTTLHVVFRGTDSTVDVLRDLMALPETTAAGDTFHSGFLRGARAVAAEVADALAAELTRDGATCDALHLVGHSLGGALALTLLGAGLLPPHDAAEHRPPPSDTDASYSEDESHIPAWCQSWKAVEKSFRFAFLIGHAAFFFILNALLEVERGLFCLELVEE